MTLRDIAILKDRVQTGELHPKQAKADLAKRLVADFHGAAAGEEAAAEFERIFARRETPEEVREVTLPAADEGLWVPKLLVAVGLAKSNGEARRLIEQGGVSIDGERVADASYALPAKASASHLVKVGKRHFVRIQFQEEGGRR